MNTEPAIREAEPGDCPQICELWNAFIRSSVVTFTDAEHTPDGLVRLVARKRHHNHPFLVATNADSVIGFATYGQFRSGPGYARTMESTIMIKAEAQYAGTGRHLMARIESHARMHDVHSIFAGVSAENAGAVSFHEKCGFAQVSRLREVGFKFGRWHDLVLLQKILD